MIAAKSWPAYLIAAGLCLALTLAVLAPSASDGLGFIPRLVFWIAHVGCALICLVAAQLALTRRGWASALPPFAEIAVAGVIGAILFTPAAMALDALFATQGVEEDDAATLIGQFVEEISWTAPPVLLFWGLLNAPRLTSLSTPEPEPAPTPDRATDFWEKVPGDLGRDLIALTAELHYLRVYTKRGDALILFSISRAEELLGDRGMRIHRSHWIAPDYVDALRSDSGRVLAVAGDLEFPVSRPHRPALRKALK